MKIRKISIIHIFLIAFMMIYSQYELYSQEADSSRVVQPGLFVGVSFGPSQTYIENGGILSVSNLVSNKQTSFGGLVEVGYFFSNYFGLSSGIGFVSYNTQLTLAAYQNKFNTTDTENEAYERQVSGSNIKEEQKIGFLSVPFCLNIRLPLSKSIGFFLQTGINMAVTLNKKHTSSGTFTFKGYYPAYNVLLENLPAYGFPNNYNSFSSGEMKIKPVNFNAVATAGFDFFVQKNIQIGIAATYSKSLSNISAYTSPEKFQLSSDVNHINSFMGGSSKVSVESLGLTIMVRYYLKPRF